MAYTLKSTGTLNINLDSSIEKIPFDLTMNYNMTSSQVIAKNLLVTSGSWTAVDTGSLSDMKYFIVKNKGTGSVHVSRTASTVGLLATLSEDDICILPCSMSIASSQVYFNIGTNTPTSSSYVYYAGIGK